MGSFKRTSNADELPVLESIRTSEGHFAKDFNTINIHINIDGVGIKGESNSITFFKCPWHIGDDMKHLMKNYTKCVQDSGSNTSYCY